MSQTTDNCNEQATYFFERPEKAAKSRDYKSRRQQQHDHHISVSGDVRTRCNRQHPIGRTDLSSDVALPVVGHNTHKKKNKQNKNKRKWRKRVTPTKSSPSEDDHFQFETTKMISISQHSLVTINMHEQMIDIYNLI